MRLEELLKKEGLSSSEISELLYRINTEKQDDEKKQDDGKKQDKSKQLSVPLLYRSNADSIPVRYVSAGKPDGITGT